MSIHREVMKTREFLMSRMNFFTNEQELTFYQSEKNRIQKWQKRRGCYDRRSVRLEIPRSFISKFEE